MSAIGLIQNAVAATLNTAKVSRSPSLDTEPCRDSGGTKAGTAEIQAPMTDTGRVTAVLPAPVQAIAGDKPVRQTLCIPAALSGDGTECQANRSPSHAASAPTKLTSITHLAIRGSE